jgi:deazaflavin-dependent oxidoreductase (nitroreductase family)
MALGGDYAPSPWDFVAEQVRLYEATDGQEGNLLEGKPCVILTTRGRRTGRLRKTPLMRVEHDGEYAVVASMGGAPKHPLWFLNLEAEPEVVLQDGARVMNLSARVATPAEKAQWWPRAVAAWPDYEAYQARTDRDIPVVVFDPR